MVFELISRENRTLTFLLYSRRLRFLSSSLPHRSRLRDHYGFVPPESLLPPNPNPSSGDWNSNRKKKKKPPYQPPSSLDRAGKDPLHSDLPFDFRFSYTESSPEVKPIGLREPKYSPFGPGRVDRTWIGHCAPAVDPTVRSVDVDEPPPAMDEEKWRRKREKILGEPLTKVEREQLVDQFQKYRSKRQINLGRDGLTHNMLNDVHNSWKNAEAVRIKCLGVPTVDMKNVCTQLEDKTGGLIIHRHGGQIILYRGRHYNPKRRPVIPLMLWKPREPIYPRLIKTVIDGLTIEETKEMRKRGLAVPALTKLAKNGYYASLVPMVRDAFLTDELVRIDCKGFEKSDYRKIGCKLKDLVPCILVTFDKEQIVVWRGKNYNSTMDPDPGEKSDTPPVYNSEEESSGDDQTGEKSNSPVYNSEEGSGDFSDQSSASFTSDYSSGDESQDEGTRTGL